MPSHIARGVLSRTDGRTLLVLALITVGTWAYSSDRSESESCFCNEVSCRPLNCSDAVLDRCGCCLTCVRRLHEPCGGKTLDQGVCAEGLQCVIQANPGDLVTGHEHGTCQELPKGCDSSACDSVITHRCPVDSVLVYNGTHETDACCKTTTECRCDLSTCTVPHCAAGHSPQIVQQSTGRPGACCNRYQCKISGCWSALGKVYKSGETWKEGDCVTCLCADGKKQCQAEMCVKTCLNPKYVPGRCCPTCDIPRLYPNQTSTCADLSTCNITCKTGLQQTPDGCRICKCKPDGCYNDCRFGYIYDSAGVQTCECHKPPTECPDLLTCSKKCSHGYKVTKKGCPKCRCNKCEPFSCDKPCYHGYLKDQTGCKTCKCQESMWERNCTVGGEVYQAGESWLGDNCTVCMCQREAGPVCDPILCPMLHCTIMVKDPGQCCPICLNTPLPAVSRDSSGQTHNDEPDSATLQKIEEKYVISLAIVGACVMILLVLVFVLLYMKLKQRHQASWSVAGQDSYCKCPLFQAHSPTLQHKYNLNSDLPKYGYSTVVVQKYNQPCIEVSLKSDTPLEEKKFLPDTEQEADYLSDSEGTNIKSKYYKDWVEM